MHRLRLISTRGKSTLAEKLKSAAGGADYGKSKQNFASGSITAKDERGADFRELYVMPKRKLRGQTQLEQATGRAEYKTRSRFDIADRLAERPPRSEEMDPEKQKWSDVWPAARTFASSVVPLPVRMGSRPNVEKRAPFKKEGNLELVKIPNFLHLTPAAIKMHCDAIKKFCTPYPPELLSKSTTLPIQVQYSTYIHQGTNIRDIRSRVVTMIVDVESLKLGDVAMEKFIRLAGDRFDEKSRELTIVTDRCHTRKQNLDYAYYLLTVLYHEANKVEQWAELKERSDNLKVEFEGSSTKTKLTELIEKAKTAGLATDEKSIDEFGKMWKEYRNTEETVETTREYGRQMRKLLGI
uniref:MRP-S28 domain-containing protein n=1 Tax=Caenorhabditis tropicalis TaxID=1561998 RepID=A0A1I7T6A4_9PELO